MSAEISMLLPKAIPDFSKWHSHTTMVVQHYGQWQDHWHFPAPYSAHPQSFSSVRSEFHYLSHPSFLDWLPTPALAHIYASGNCVQFSLVTQSCPTLCDPVNRSTPGLPVHHLFLEFTQTHVHRVSDAIQPSHPLSSPSPSAPNPSQHRSLFQWVNSSHEVAKGLEFQL